MFKGFVYAPRHRRPLVFAVCRTSRDPPPRSHINNIISTQILVLTSQALLHAMMLYCFFVPQAVSKDCWVFFCMWAKHLAQLLKLLQSVCMVHGKNCTEEGGSKLQLRMGFVLWWSAAALPALRARLARGLKYNKPLIVWRIPFWSKSSS